MSMQSIDKLVAEGRIRILEEENTAEYVKVLLDKLEKNVNFSFVGNINLKLYYPKTGPFFLDITPFDSRAHIVSLDTKENSENTYVYWFPGCIQIKLSDIVYQIRFPCRY